MYVYVNMYIFTHIYYSSIKIFTEEHHQSRVKIDRYIDRYSPPIEECQRKYLESSQSVIVWNHTKWNSKNVLQNFFHTSTNQPISSNQLKAKGSSKEYPHRLNACQQFPWKVGNTINNSYARVSNNRHLSNFLIVFHCEWKKVKYNNKTLMMSFKKIYYSFS